MNLSTKQIKAINCALQCLVEEKSTFVTEDITLSPSVNLNACFQQILINILCWITLVNEIEIERQT